MLDKRIIFTKIQAENCIIPKQKFALTTDNGREQFSIRSIKHMDIKLEWSDCYAYIAFKDGSIRRGIINAN